MFELFYNRDISKASYDRFIDSFQKIRLYNIDISMKDEIMAKKNYITNKLSIEEIEYRYLLCGTTNGSILLYDLCSSENDCQQRHDDDSTYIRNNISSTIIKNNNNKNIFKPKLEYNGYSQLMNRHQSSLYGSIISSLQWYPEDSGAFIASSMNGHVSIFDTNMFTIIIDFKFPDNIVYCSRLRTSHHSYNNNNNYYNNNSSTSTPLIAVGLHDCTIRLCDPRTKDAIHNFKGGHNKQVTCIEWNPLCDYQILSSDMNGVMKIWDIRRSGIQAMISSFDWREDFNCNSSNHRRNNSSSGSRSSSYGVNNNNISHTLSQQVSNIRNNNNNIHASTNLIQIQARSSIAVSSSSSSSSHAHIAASRAHDGGIMSMQYTSCGRYIVSAGNDGKLRLWNTQTNALARHIAYTNIVDDTNISTSYSSSSSSSINSTNIVPICNLPYDLCIIEFQSTLDDIVIVPSAPSSSSLSSSSSSSSYTSAKKRSEGNLLMIPLHSTDGKPIRILKGHFDRVTSIIYRQPYQQIITCSKDGMIFLWDTSANHHQQQHHPRYHQHHHQQQQHNHNQNDYHRNKDNNLIIKSSNRPGSYDFQNILKTFKTDNNSDASSSVDNWSDDNDDNDNDNNHDVNSSVFNHQKQINNKNNYSNHNFNNKINSKIGSKKRKRNDAYVPPIILKYLEDTKRELSKKDTSTIKINDNNKVHTDNATTDIIVTNNNNSSSSRGRGGSSTVRDFIHNNNNNPVITNQVDNFTWDRVDDLFSVPIVEDRTMPDPTELNKHQTLPLTELSIHHSLSQRNTTHSNTNISFASHINTNLRTTTMASSSTITASPRSSSSSSSSSSSMQLNDNKVNTSYKEWIKKTKLNRSNNSNYNSKSK